MHDHLSTTSQAPRGSSRIAPIRAVPGRMTAYRRAKEKRRTVIHWLLRFHFSSAEILLQLLGLNHKQSHTVLKRMIDVRVIERIQPRDHSTPLYVLTRKALVLTGYDDLLVAKYQSRVSLRLDHDLAVQRATLALAQTAVDFAPARITYYQQMERITEHLDRLNAELLAARRRPLTEFERAGRAYVRQINGDVLDKDEAALARKHGKVIAAQMERIGTEAFSAIVFPEDAIADSLASEEVTKAETHKIKFPDVLITYAEDDILAIEIERTRGSWTKLGDSLLTHARSIEEGRWHRVRYLCPTDDIARRLASRFAALDLQTYRDEFSFEVTPEYF